MALVRFALTCPDLHPDHPRRLLNEAIWFWTERGSPARKYRLRFRTPAALALQHDLGLTQAAKQLAHEHVHERAQVVARLKETGADLAGVLRSAEACVVTREEHRRLAEVAPATGWARYRKAGIHPIDMNSGQPMDLEAAIASDSAIWG